MFCKAQSQSSSSPDAILTKAREHRSKSPAESSLAARTSGVQRRRGLRVLQIDGGGSKGIVAVTILRKIEALVQDQWMESEGPESDKEVHLGDHFDLVAGTSVGGMIALGHAHCGVRLEHLEEFLQSGAVFASNRMGRWWNIARTGGKFSGDRVEKFMEKVLLPRAEGDKAMPLDEGETGRKRRSEERDDLQPQPDKKFPRVFAVANPVNTQDTMLFANYPADEYVREAVKDTDGVKPRLCSTVLPSQAARATSAAPTYFPAAELGIPKEGGEETTSTHFFWDGGMVNNSPVSEAVTEAQMLFGYERGIELVVSIGCGINGPAAEEQEDAADSFGLNSYSQEFKGGWLIRQRDQLLNDLLNAITNSEKEFQLAKRHLIANGHGFPSETMFRFNPPNITMEMDESDPEVLAKVKEQVEEWCNTEEVLQQLNAVAAILCRKVKDPVAALPELKECGVPEEELAREKALRHAHRFAPVLAPLQDPSKNRAGADSKRDPRYVDYSKLAEEEQIELWTKQFDVNLVPILDYLERDSLKLLLLNWAQAKTRGAGIAQDVESLRFTIWRGYLDRLLKSAMGEYNKELLKGVGHERLARAAMALLPLDRANALQVMKINRLDPKCPSGFAWISKNDLKALEEELKEELKEEFKEASVPAVEDLFKVGTERQRHSIDKHLVALVEFLSNAAKEPGASPTLAQMVPKLEGFIKPKAPEWMANAPKWMKDEERRGFAVLYKKIMS
ncbi:unnamed protein product [Chrysoparadoxa australica]